MKIPGTGLDPASCQQQHLGLGGSVLGLCSLDHIFSSPCKLGKWLALPSVLCPPRPGQGGPLCSRDGELCALLFELPHCPPRRFRGSDPLLFSLGSKNSILKDAMAAGTPKVSEHSSARFTPEGCSLLPVTFPAQTLPRHSLFPSEVAVLGCPQQCHALWPVQQRGCCPYSPTVLERPGPRAAWGQ